MYYPGFHSCSDLIKTKTGLTRRQDGLTAEAGRQTVTITEF